MPEHESPNKIPISVVHYLHILTVKGKDVNDSLEYLLSCRMVIINSSGGIVMGKDLSVCSRDSRIRNASCLLIFDRSPK